MSIYFPPLVVDVSARFESRSGYFISPGIERKFDELSSDYKESTWFGGHYGGRARIFTDSHGMGTGSRVEVGRAVLDSRLLEAKMEDVFRLFQEAQKRGLTSGGITSIRIIFNKKGDMEECLYFIKRAFDSVLGDTFAGSSAAERLDGTKAKDSASAASPKGSWKGVFYNAHSYYELGMALVHEPLTDHLFNTGPYNAKHKPLLEEIQKELDSEEGSYEGISVFVLVDKNAVGRRDTIGLVYTSDGRKEELERKMEDKCGVSLRFLEDPSGLGEHEELLTLQTYGAAIRTYGALWMLKPSDAEDWSASREQDELPGTVLTLARKYVPLLYLFFDDRYVAEDQGSDGVDSQDCRDENPEESRERIEIPQDAQTWDQLYEKLSRSPRVSKSHSESPTYLDSGLRRLENLGLIERTKDECRLADDFAEWKHVTYYSLDDYRRAISELRVDAGR